MNVKEGIYAQMEKLESVSEIQDVLLNILKYIKEICEKHNLEFYLSNGTLLGAIKYNGFVPWDDDVDIFMPREDYDQFMKLDINTDVYELLSKEKNPSWNMPYAKLKDKRTYLKENTADFGMELGIAVDIFPLDNWNGNEARAMRQAKYCSLLRRCLSASIEEEFQSPRKGIKRLILYIIWKFSKCCGSDYFYKLIQKEVNKGLENKAVSYSGSVAWALYGKKEVIPSSVFNEKINVLFCDELFPAPAGYDIYLKNLYGDYHQDPPKEKQKSHHNVMAWWKDEYK